MDVDIKSAGFTSNPPKPKPTAETQKRKLKDIVTQSLSTDELLDSIEVKVYSGTINSSKIWCIIFDNDFSIFVNTHGEDWRSNKDFLTKFELYVDSVRSVLA